MELVAIDGENRIYKKEAKGKTILVRYEGIEKLVEHGDEGIRASKIIIEPKKIVYEDIFISLETKKEIILRKRIRRIYNSPVKKIIKEKLKKLEERYFCNDDFDEILEFVFIS